MSKILRLLPCTTAPSTADVVPQGDVYSPKLAEITDHEVSHPYLRTVPVCIAPNTGAFHPEVPPINELTPEPRLTQVIQRAVDIVINDASSFKYISDDQELQGGQEEAPPTVKVYLTGLDQAGKRTMMKQLEHNWSTPLNLARTQCTNILRLVSNTLAFLCERVHLYGAVTRPNTSIYNYLLSLNTVYHVEAYHNQGEERFVFTHNIRVDDSLSSFYNPKPNRGTDALLGPIEAYVNLWNDPVIQKVWNYRHAFSPSIELYRLEDQQIKHLEAHTQAASQQQQQSQGENPEEGNSGSESLATPMGFVPLQITPTEPSAPLQVNHPHADIKLEPLYRSMRSIHRHFHATFPRHSIKAISKYTTTPYPENVEHIMPRLSLYLKAQAPEPPKSTGGDDGHRFDPSMLDKVIPFEYVDALLDSNPRPYDDCSSIIVTPDAKSSASADDQDKPRRAKVVLAPGAVNRRHRGMNEIDNISTLVFCASLTDYAMFVSENGNDFDYTTDNMTRQVENKLVHSLSYFRQLIELPSLNNCPIHVIFTREYNLKERFLYPSILDMFPDQVKDDPIVESFGLDEYCDYVKAMYTRLYQQVYDDHYPAELSSSTPSKTPVDGDVNSGDEEGTTAIASESSNEDGEGKSSPSPSATTDETAAANPVELRTPRPQLHFHFVDALDKDGVLRTFSEILQSSSSLDELDLPQPDKKKKRKKNTSPTHYMLADETRQALEEQVRRTLQERFPLLAVEREREEEQIKLKGNRYENLIRFHCRYRAYWYNIHVPHFTHLFDKADVLTYRLNVMPKPPQQAVVSNADGDTGAGDNTTSSGKTNSAVVGGAPGVNSDGLSNPSGQGEPTAQPPGTTAATPQPLEVNHDDDDDDLLLDDEISPTERNSFSVDGHEASAQDAQAVSSDETTANTAQHKPTGEQDEAEGQAKPCEPDESATSDVSTPIPATNQSTEPDVAEPVTDKDSLSNHDTPNDTSTSGVHPTTSTSNSGVDEQEDGDDDDDTNHHEQQNTRLSPRQHGQTDIELSAL